MSGSCSMQPSSRRLRPQSTVATPATANRDAVTPHASSHARNQIAIDQDAVKRVLSPHSRPLGIGENGVVIGEIDIFLIDFKKK